MSQAAPADTVHALDARTKRRAFIMIWLGLLMYGVIWILFSQLWLLSFTSGSMPGPYWLMIACYIGTIPLAIVELFVAPLLVLVFPVRLIPENRRELFRQSKGAQIAVLMLAGLVTGLSVWHMMLQDFRHSETANIGGHVYQTAIEHGFFNDEKAYVYQCDQLGLWCRRVYFTPDSDRPRIAKTRLMTGKEPEMVSLEICWGWPSEPASCETKQIPLTQGDLP